MTLIGASRRRVSRRWGWGTDSGSGLCPEDIDVRKDLGAPIMCQQNIWNYRISGPKPVIPASLPDAVDVIYIRLQIAWVIGDVDEVIRDGGEHLAQGGRGGLAGLAEAWRPLEDGQLIWLVVCCIQSVNGTVLDISRVREARSGIEEVGDRVYVGDPAVDGVENCLFSLARRKVRSCERGADEEGGGDGE
jgi:hypothetical protein